MAFNLRKKLEELHSFQEDDLSSDNQTLNLGVADQLNDTITFSQLQTLEKTLNKEQKIIYVESGYTSWSQYSNTPFNCIFFVKVIFDKCRYRGN